MPAPVKRFEGADEDNIAGIQFVIIGTPFQQIGINHGLIITCTAIQAVVLGLADLHFDVVDCVFIISYENIKADAFAVVLHLHVLFFFRIGDIPDGDLQDSGFDLVTHVIHPFFIIA